MPQFPELQKTLGLCLLLNGEYNSPSTVRSSHRVGWYIALLCIVLLPAGCRSSGFRASQLPSEFRSQGRSHSENIDLSRIAVPGASESLIATSDLLKIDVSTGRDDDESKPVMARVADDGTVDVPVIGPVPVAGLEVFEASQNIVNLAIQRGMYRHPLVTVEIEEKAVNRVTVLGAVNEPGVHEIPRGNCDLVSALAASGGLTEDAGTEVEIIRQPHFGLVAADTQQQDEIQLASYDSPPKPQASSPGRKTGWSQPKTIRFDLASGQLPQGADYRLLDRDVIRVVSRKKEVIHVAGLVKEPGQFELPPDEEIHLLDAVALAGGRSSPVADKVLIIRQLENQPKPLMIQASLSQAKKDPLENLLLASGDSISLEQTPTTVVVDTVSKFFRLTFGVASTSVF